MDRKAMKKRIGSTGWTLVLYYILMNVCVIVFAVVQTMMAAMGDLLRGNMEAVQSAAEAAMTNGWGYITATAIGFLILLLWKKPRFWREQIWARGRPMKPGDFFSILAIFLSAQLLYQIYVMVLELCLRYWGLTILVGMQEMVSTSDSLSMFLYIAIIAPIAEEILFRGLIQRTLMPFGKGFAIFASAFLFGLFHGNILQTPVAFVVGLVLGYVAAEYSIAWAMILHMVNNLVLGDMLTRLIPNEIAAGILLWIILMFCAVSALIVLICRRREIRQWRTALLRTPGAYGCFFSSAGVITLTVLMLASMVLTCFSIITPL